VLVRQHRPAGGDPSEERDAPFARWTEDMLRRLGEHDGARTPRRALDEAFLLQREDMVVRALHAAVVQPGDIAHRRGVIILLVERENVPQNLLLPLGQILAHTQL